MAKTKATVAAFVAAVALSAVLSATALATTPGWMVNGTLLPANSKLALKTKAQTMENTLWHWADGVSIECKEVESSSAFIVGTVKAEAGSIVFDGCKVTSPPECKLSSEKIQTLPVLLKEITLDNELLNPLGVKGTIEPENTSKLFYTLAFKEGCILEGVIGLKGKIRFLMPEGQDERVLQRVLLFTLPGDLTFPSAGAEIHGDVLVGLVNGLPWSFL